MAKPRTVAAAWVLLAIVCGVVGFGAGLRKGQRFMLSEFQRVDVGDLSQHVEVLSLLRMGEAEAAIVRLESESDQLTTAIAGLAKLSPHSDKGEVALASYKTYLSVAPPSPAREAALASALDGVPILAPSKCDTALKTLLVSVQGKPIK